MYRLTVLEPNVIYNKWYEKYTKHPKETYYFTDKEKGEFIIYKLLNEKRKLKRNANDELVYRIIHKVSGYCIAECERKDITPIIKHFQSINLNIFDNNGNVHGYIGKIEVTMQLFLHHTIEEI